MENYFRVEWHPFMSLLLSENTSCICHLLYPSPSEMMFLASQNSLLEDMFWPFIQEQPHCTRQLLLILVRWQFYPPTLITFEIVLVLLTRNWLLVLWYAAGFHQPIWIFAEEVRWVSDTAPCVSPWMFLIFKVWCLKTRCKWNYSRFLSPFPLLGQNFTD